MEVLNGYWVDVNDNKWNCALFSEKQAEEKSYSLNNCHHCIDCSNCKYCSNCNDCNDCNDCNYCDGCVNCNSSFFCKCCDNCNYCGYCNDCDNCDNCGYCDHCDDCNNCSYCHCCENCSYCINCKICDNFDENPQRITSNKIGSRKTQSTYYWTEKSEQVICGCYKGTLDNFEKRVQETHSGTIYEKEYLNWIHKIRVYKNTNL
jgi:hypothetical protein